MYVNVEGEGIRVTMGHDEARRLGLAVGQGLLVGRDRLVAETGVNWASVGRFRGLLQGRPGVIPPRALDVPLGLGNVTVIDADVDQFVRCEIMSDEVG